MNFDLWVDGQQLPRQLTMKSLEPKDSTVTTAMRFRDFGKPVQITEPPASEVTDADQ